MDRLLSKAEVLERVGVSYPTVWLWMRQGRFPKPHDLGGVIRWRESELADWLERQPRREYKPAPRKPEAA